MTTLRRTAFAVCLAIFFSLFGNPGTASACSCAGGITISNNFAIHDAVFAGKVLRITDNYSPVFSTLDRILGIFGKPGFFFWYFLDTNQDNRIGFSIFLNVIDSWKGVRSNYVEVSTGRGGSDCGYEFQNGQEYLVYASYAYGVPGNYWVTSICSGNSLLGNNLADLDYLDSKPTLSLQNSIPKLWTGQDLIILLLSVLTGSLFLGSGIYIANKRSRARRDP